MHLRGDLQQYETPDWTPLLALVGEDLVDWFMWMHEARLEDGTAVHAYKHEATRRYLLLARDGRAFAFTGDERFIEVPPADAIDDAFHRWEDTLPRPTVDDRAALRAARARAARRAAA